MLTSWMSISPRGPRIFGSWIDEGSREGAQGCRGPFRRYIKERASIRVVDSSSATSDCNGADCLCSARTGGTLVDCPAALAFLFQHPSFETPRDSSSCSFNWRVPVRTRGREVLGIADYRGIPSLFKSIYARQAPIFSKLANEYKLSYFSNTVSEKLRLPGH